MSYQGYIAADGTRRYPSTCLVCNFDMPSEGRQCLLQHGEVVVLFHELGHGIHDLVAKTQYARFHGASTADDFNEAPSQMLEQWCWHSQTLDLLSRGTRRTALGKVMRTDGNESRGVDIKKAVPNDIVRPLLQGKREKNALKILGILNVSRFQMALSTIESPQQAASINTTELFHKMTWETLGTDRPQEEMLPPTQACLAELFTVNGLQNYLV